MYVFLEFRFRFSEIDLGKEFRVIFFKNVYFERILKLKDFYFMTLEMF